MSLITLFKRFDILLLFWNKLKFLGSSKFMRLLSGYFNADFSFLFRHLFSKLSIAIRILARSEILFSFLELVSYASLLSLFFWSSMTSNFYCRLAMSLFRDMISVFMSFSYLVTVFFKSSNSFSRKVRF